MREDDSLIRRQIEYYRARASEYDEWFLRVGRYDRGEEHRKRWLGEVEAVRKELESSKPDGDILELACGTGLWTEYLAPFADKLVAVDSSEEAIMLNRDRLKNDRVSYIQADLFSWKPSARFDFVFFAFWLSHIPRSRFDEFWVTVKAALKPDGRVFFVDSLLTQDSTAKNHAAIDNRGRVTRKLNNGREYEIVKVFHEPAKIEHRLKELEWQGYVRTTERFFLYGSMSRR
jgi:demethylmenaquinone methyltransferase/2-methoxy-6-polyprenyl-1,4-benzoquinol methylase